MTGPSTRSGDRCCFSKMSLLFIAAVMTLASQSAFAVDELRVGVAQTDITPPLGFPISGYYHERLATGTIDPLWAKAIYFESGDTKAAWVVCDLTGVGTDLSTEVRKRAAKATGIPADQIVVSATHSHTAPDYYRSLYFHLGPAEEIKSDKDRERAVYAGRLVETIVKSIVDAQAAAQPAQLLSGTIQQEPQVSYCRRFVMKDGSVATWVGLKHPQAVRSTAEIDPEVSVVKVQSLSDRSPLGVISNFALHLDTTGGTEWSSDYPYAIEQAVQNALGKNVISLFGTGCCGDINHAEPNGEPRRKAIEIGAEIGKSVTATLPNLVPVEHPQLQVRSQIVSLPFEEASPADVQHSVNLIKTINQGEKIPFLDHVLAYKRLVLDQLTHSTPNPESNELVSLGLSRTLKGVGEHFPAKVTVMTLGDEVALVFLPGEIFNELGRSIKEASPYRNTLVVELSDSVETIYIPNRHAYVGGGYEPTNSLVQPGSGERLVEAAVSLLRESATESTRDAAKNAP